LLNFKKNILQSNSFISLFLITGVIGFILGIIKADFQVSLEAAQVLLGLVQYEPSSLIYEYYSNNYSLINYLSALFLYLSNSEILSSILISGIVGCIGMQTLGMLLFLITGDLWVSVALSLILALKNIFLPGISYSINFLGTPHTYGRLGLFFSLYPILIASLLSQKIGALLSSISLIIHPVYGALLNVSLLVANFRKKNWVNPTNIKYYLYGVLFVLVIFLYQKIAFFSANEVSDIARLDALKDAESIFKNYLLDWDKHRQKFNGIETLNLSFLCSIGTFILALVNIHIIHKKKTGINKEIFWFYVLIFTFISWIFFYIPSWLDISYKNRFLISIMPSRLINLSIFIFTPVLLGTLYIGIKKYFNKLLNTKIFFSVYLISALIFGFHLLNKLTKISRFNFDIEHLEKFDHKSYVLTTDSLLQVKNRVKVYTPIIDGFIYNSNPSNLIKLNNFSEEIFGISLKERSELSNDLLHKGEIPSKAYKDTWGERSCQEWLALSKKYDIKLITTESNFKLKLKEISKNESIKQYIPICDKN
jgi:hypothetical protein